MDIGAHGIDLIRSLTGQEIIEVCARFDEGDGQPAHTEGILQPQAERVLLGKEISAWMHYELSAGTVVSHEVQWLQTGTSRFEAQIYGTEGTIFLRAPRTGADLAFISNANPGDEWIMPELPGRPAGQAQHETLVRSILTGDNSAQTGHDGMAVLRVCEAARRSAESRRWVKVS